MADLQISNYTTLQAAIASYLGRGDMTNQIPLFIQLAEADMRRNLKALPVRVERTLDTDDDTHAVLGELVAIRLNTDSYKHEILLTSQAALANYKRYGSGVPRYAAMLAGQLLLEFDIQPDTAYPVVEVYRPQFVSLSSGNPTNAIIIGSPDIYLYGALKEAAPYLEHDERNPMWAAKYQKAVDDENIARERGAYGDGTILIPRFPIRFP